MRAGGAQSYPSRTKDEDDVDFSTGSVGLGVTLFASLVQDYLLRHQPAPEGARRGRMISLLGDAELDEGNIYEALLEGWKQDVRDLRWIVDDNLARGIGPAWRRRLHCRPGITAGPRA